MAETEYSKHVGVIPCYAKTYHLRAKFTTVLFYTEFVFTFTK